MREFALAFVMALMVAGLNTVLAGEPYEAIGFTPNHVFEDGGFGENIDLMTGTVNLSYPVGPTYQVGPSLSYQFVLHYNSHFWKYDDVDNTSSMTLPGRVSVSGCFGAGIRGHLGRVYRDYNDYDEDGTDDQDGNGTDATEVWRFESADGSQHYFGTASSYEGSATQFLTVDGTFIRMTKLDDTLDGTIDGWVAEMPDGTRLILDWKVGTPESPKDPQNGIRSTNGAQTGWYVTRIEGPEDPDGSHSPPQNNCSNIHYDCNRPHWVEIAYQQVGSACPLSIRDSINGVDGRTMSFHLFGNTIDRIQLPGSPTVTYNFEYAQGTLCDPRYEIMTHNCPSTYTVSNPLLTKISYPTVGGSRFQVDLGWTSTTEGDADGTAARANYGLIVRRTLPYVYSPTGPAPPRVLYKYHFPSYAKDHSTSVEATKKRLIWTKPDNSEVSYWWYYLRPDDQLEGEWRAYASTSSCLREPVGIGVFQANCINPQGPVAIPPPPRVETTNPAVAKVWDPFGNLTVYYYKTYWYDTLYPGIPSDPYASNATACHSYSTGDPDYRECPSFWDAGLMSTVRLYKGCMEDPANLVRETTYEYDKDTSGGSPTKFQYRRPRGLNLTDVFWVGRNVRKNKETVAYLDAASQVGGPPTTTVEYSDWDGLGHYRRTIEKNERGEVYRTRATSYLGVPLARPWFTGRFNSQITENASGVAVERTDYCWSGNPASNTKATCLVREKDPAQGWTCGACAPTDGSVAEELVYQEGSSATDLPLGSLLSRQSRGGDVAQSFKSLYFYAPGGYLKKEKIVVDTQTGVTHPWYPLDRDWDSTRGLVLASRDRAHIQTAYQYDPLGRLTRIDPPAPEADTVIIFQNDGLQVDVVQSDTTLGEIRSTYFYDPLYRLRELQKQTADGNAPSQQQIQYDAGNRITSRTEWFKIGFPGATSTFSYDSYTGQSCSDKDYDGRIDLDYNGSAQKVFTDPLGRVTQSLVGGVETITAYSGLDKTVTVNGIAGTTGTLSSVTMHRNDGFGRLVGVDSPPGGADAVYAYDVKDNLLRATLSGYDAAGTWVPSQTRWFNYDALGRLRSSTNPENGTQQFTKYDSIGTLREKIDPKGNSFTMTSDTAGRPTELRTTGGPVLFTNSYYDTTGDTSGRLDTAISNDSDGTMVSWRKQLYTALNGRPSELQVKLGGWSTTPPILKTVYQYNNFGAVSQIAYPLMDGENRSRSSPAFVTHNGFLTALTDAVRRPQGAYLLENITYTPGGSPFTIYGPNNQHLDMGYDAWNRPSRFLLRQYRTSCSPPEVTIDCSGDFPCADEQADPCQAQWDTWWDTGDYEYDQAGNIKTIGNNWYRYDTLSRLADSQVATAGSDTGRRAYAYDDFGNIKTEWRYTNGALAATRNFAVSGATNGATNRLVSMDEASANPFTVAYTFDQAGNMTQNGFQINTWDNRGRLSSVQPGAGAAPIRYGYDGSDYRVRKTESGLETFYVRDEAGQVLSEFRRPTGSSMDPVWDKDYIYALGRAVALVKNAAPATPKNLRVDGFSNTSSMSVTLKWDAVSESDLLSYVLERCRDDDGDGTPNANGCVPMTITGWSDPETGASSPPATQKIDNTIGSQITNPSTLVRYRIWATDTASNSSIISNSLIVRPVQTAAGLGAPEWASPAKLVGDKKVTLRWTNGSEVDLFGYNLYRSTTSETLGNKVNNMPLSRSECAPSTICFTDFGFTNGALSGLTNGTTYYYRLKPVDGAKREGPSVSGQQSAVPQDVDAPAPPQGVRALSGPTLGRIELSWQLGDEPDIATYEITRTPGGVIAGNFIPTGSVCPDRVCTYPDTSGLVYPQSYTYSLKVRDFVNNLSAPSSTVTLKPRSTSPVAPSLQSAAFIIDPGTRAMPAYADCDLWHLLDDRSRVKLTLSSFGSSLKYRVYKRPSAPAAGTWQMVGEAPAEVGPSGTGLRYDDSPGPRKYDYAVSAVDSSGQESANSSTVPEVTDTFGTLGPATGDFQAVDTVESASTLLAASIGPDCTFTYLAWSPCLEQSLVGYKVYRYCEGTGANINTERCPMGWELMSGPAPMTVAEYLDRDVNPPGGRKTRLLGASQANGKGYVWYYMVTAVLERPDGTRVEARATELPSINLEQCEGGIAADYLKCGNTTATSFPAAGLNHELAPQLSPPATLPSTPTGLTATQGVKLSGDPYYEAGVRIEWAAGDPTTLSGYHLYYQPKGSSPPAWKPVDTYLQDQNVDGTWEPTSVPILLAKWGNAQNKIVYIHNRRQDITEYKVRAVDQYGRESGDSAVVEGYPWIYPPGTHGQSYESDFNSTRMCDPITLDRRNHLTWTDGDGDPSNGLVFNIYRKQGSNTEVSLAQVNGALSYDDAEPSITPSLNYTYRIVGVYGSNGTEFFSQSATTNANDHSCELVPRDEDEHSIAVLNESLTCDSHPSTTVIAQAPCGAVRKMEVALGTSVGDATEGNWGGLIGSGQAADACVSSDLRPTRAAAQLGPEQPLALLESRYPMPTVQASPTPSGPAHIGIAGPGWEVQLLWADHLGSTRVVSTVEGALQSRHSYYPFGEGVAGVSSSLPYSTHEFTGHERDRETGLDYMLARYYSSSLSRFLSTDPVTGSPSDPQGWNRYSYVHNNPLALVDPDGRDDIYVFRPTATSSTATWRAVQAQAPKFGNTVTIYNGAAATVARFTQAASNPDAHVVVSGHSVHDQSGTVGSMKLADGDVGTMTSTTTAPTSTSSVQASTVGLFGCQTEDMAGQFTSGTVTTVSSGSDGNTSLRALDDGAVAYSDALSRNRDPSTAARQADGAIQKSKDPQDRNGDKTVVHKQQAQGGTP